MMTADDKMPFGAHRGTPMGEVPADYLVWLMNQKWVNGRVKDYLTENKESIEKDAGVSKKSGLSLEQQLANAKENLAKISAKYHAGGDENRITWDDLKIQAQSEVKRLEQKVRDQIK